ncbi:MAG: hypothetical protein ABT940_02570, partial [Alphaproteobacteria bacterium]
MHSDTADTLAVHFFTIVLNGRPFIEYHAERFARLSCEWHWHVVEGVAALRHDTAWSVAHGGSISQALHDNGRSNDGTSEYLDALVERYPDRVTVYRKPPGEFWDGKIEMVRAPLANLPRTCLLWQVDADELWTVSQIETLRRMFLADSGRMAAFFLCSFFVGPNLVATGVDNYGNNRGYEWLRAWRYQTGDQWVAHEPPRLSRPRPDGSLVEVVALGAFLHEETAIAGLMFQHFAYATREQLEFKEVYYGYRGAVASWERLNGEVSFPRRLADFFPWVQDAAGVEHCSRAQVRPLAYPLAGDTGEKCWTFDPEPPPLNLDAVKCLLAQASPLRRRTVVVGGENPVVPLTLDLVRAVAVLLLQDLDAVVRNLWSLRAVRKALP